MSDLFTVPPALWESYARFIQGEARKMRLRAEEAYRRAEEAQRLSRQTALEAEEAQRLCESLTLAGFLTPPREAPPYPPR